MVESIKCDLWKNLVNNLPGQNCKRKPLTKTINP